MSKLELTIQIALCNPQGDQHYGPIREAIFADFRFAQ